MFYNKKIILGLALTSFSFNFGCHISPDISFKDLVQKKQIATEVKAEMAKRYLKARMTSPIFYRQDQKPSKYDLAMAKKYSDETYSGNEKAARRQSFADKKAADNRRAAARQEIKNKKPGNRRN